MSEIAANPYRKVIDDAYRAISKTGNHPGNVESDLDNDDILALVEAIKSLENLSREVGDAVTVIREKANFAERKSLARAELFQAAETVKNALLKHA